MTNNKIQDYWIRSYEYEIKECKSVRKSLKPWEISQKKKFDDMIEVLEKGLIRVKKYGK